MPILTINTNRTMDDDHCTQVMEAAVEMLAETLDKPKGSILVIIRPNCKLQLGETSEPAAFIEFKLFDFQNRCEEFVEIITEFVHKTLEIAPDRQFMEFTEMTPAMFGWNGKTC